MTREDFAKRLASASLRGFFLGCGGHTDVHDDQMDTIPRKSATTEVKKEMESIMQELRQENKS